MFLLRNGIATVLLGVILMTVFGGCVWRMGNEEHYLGPVLLRQVQPPEGKAYVSQQIHFPFVLEGGEQWGISLGYQNRIVAMPQKRPCRYEEELKEIFEHKHQSNIPAKSKEWTFQLFSVNYIQPQMNSKFISRTNVGVTLGFGKEANGLTIGGTRLTELNPSVEGHYIFLYGNTSPLETVFKFIPRERCAFSVRDEEVNQ